MQVSVRRARAWFGSGVAVALFLLLGSIRVAQAGTVYKCSDAQGHVAYQDHACTGSATQTQIELAPPPPADAPRQRAASTPRSAPPSRARRVTARRTNRKAAVVSYECRSADGEVFYRHRGCPKSIAVDAMRMPEPAYGSRSRRGGVSTSVSVSARPLSRAEACHRLAAAGSIGRAGHEHDEVVSTYDRNAGRDPCRDW